MLAVHSRKDLPVSNRARPKLVLIDGYSLLFRAYLTPGPYLATSDGRPTGALHGFSNMLLSLLNQEKPDAVYVAWDAPGKTFRDEKFEEYKAHRPEVADDLRAQFGMVRELVDAFGIASAEVPGFEADDLVGTLATVGVREGYDVVIVTGDTDQLQLVGDGVTVRLTRTGVSATDEYDEERVRERYGLEPERIPDFKALLGDTSDNIPGVRGIGKVTATKLLQQYETLENLLEHVDDLPEKGAKDQQVKQALKEGIETAKLSKELATIHCEAPFQGPIQRYDPTPEVWGRVRALFADLEFRGLLQRLPIAQTAPVGETQRASEESFACENTIIESEDALREALTTVRSAGICAVRLQLDSTSAVLADIVGMGFSAAPGRAYYVAVRKDETSETSGDLGGLFGEEGERETYAAPLDALRSLFEDPGVTLIGHNVKPDIIALERRGIRVRPYAFDTLIGAYVLNPGRNAYPLMDLAEEHLRLRLDAPGATVPEEHLPLEAALILALHGPMAERIRAHEVDQIIERLEMPLVPILADMECIGVPVDRAWLERLSGEMAERADGLAERIYELAEERFAIGSTQQLQRVLFEKLKLPTGKKIKTGYSTRADLLESLAPQYEIAQRILEYREVTKLKSTYADALPRLVNPRTGRIHTSLNQTVAATGRLSSSDPNLQNIPIRSEAGREIRKAFIAPAGQVLLSCDYSQIELRVFAHVTGDPELRRAFLADEDIHAATASRVFNVPLDLVSPEMRRRAKTVNFAVIYGQSDFGLANQLGISTAEAQAFITSYFEQFPGVKAYNERTLAAAREKGYVQTLMGRRRYLPEINSGNFNIRQAAERAAVNMPIQGTAADIMKLAMIEVYRALQPMCYNCTLLLQVHDELVFGVEEGQLPAVLPAIIERMENAYKLDVRLKVDAKVGDNWAEMKAVRL
jgi:DNA polymerase I